MSAVAALGAQALEARAEPAAWENPPGSVAALPAAAPRRLAHVLRPASGESFDSWIDRYAQDNTLPAGDAALALGLETRVQSVGVRPKAFGIALSDGAAAHIARRTGIGIEQLHAMQLARYHGTLLDLSRLDLRREASIVSLARQEWALFNASRACPRCLAESPVWPLWWRLGIAALCPRHRVLLVDTCPLCGLALRRGAAQHPRPLSRRDQVASDKCGSTLGYGARCTQPYAEIPTIEATQGLIAAQQVALQVLDGEVPPIAGVAVQAREWFTALRYLTAMIRLTMTAAQLGRFDWAGREIRAALDAEWITREDKHRHGTGNALRAIPGSPLAAAAILAVACPVLTAPDTTACAVLLEPMVAAANEVRRRDRRDPLRAFPRPVQLAEAEHALTTPINRVAGAMPGAAARRASPLRLRHVPHLADTVDYAELIAPLLPGTFPLSGRRLAALSAARFLGARSWPQAAHALGMQPRLAARVTDTVLQRIVDTRGYWAAIDQLVARMERRGAIDYQARRAALRDLREVPFELLYAACHPLGYPVTPARRRHGAAWIWARLTCGDPREAPAYQGQWDALATSIRQGYHQFELWLPDPVAAALTDFGTSVLSEKITDTRRRPA